MFETNWKEKRVENKYDDTCKYISESFLVISSLCVTISLYSLLKCSRIKYTLTRVLRKKTSAEVVSPSVLTRNLADHQILNEQCLNHKVCTRLDIVMKERIG